MNKLLPILLVVVLSGCSSEPTVPSTTEPMYFKCGGTLPVVVNITNKSISHYMEKMGLYFSWIQQGGAYYKVYDVKNKRLNYQRGGGIPFAGTLTNLIGTTHNKDTNMNDLLDNLCSVNSKKTPVNGDIELHNLITNI